MDKKHERAINGNCRLYFLYDFLVSPLEEVELGVVNILEVEDFLSVHFLAGSDHYRTITGEHFNQIFNTLDDTIKSKPHDIFLISHKIHFVEKILNTLWAISRGIHVIFCPAEKEIEDFLSNQDKFIMDFGLFYFGHDQAAGKNKYLTLLNTVRHADRNNYQAVWTPERHFNEFGGLFPNPSVLSASLATITEAIQIRSGSLVSPLHDSVRIAEDWSVIDNLSEGRAAISFASGWQSNDFVFQPDRYAIRHEYMISQIEEVRNLWAGKSLERENGLGNKIELKIFPRPVQKELPVWITVSGKIETFIDAGKLGANILTHLLWQDPDELIEKIQAYRQSLKESGFDPAAGIVSVMLHTFIGKNDEEVKDLVRRPLKEYIKSSVHLIETMTSKVPGKHDRITGRYGRVEEKTPEALLEELVEIAFDRFFENAALLGSPEKCHELVRRLHGYGINDLACLIDFGLDHTTINEGLKMLDPFKDLYSSTVINRFNVTLVRCQQEDLSKLSASLKYPNALRKIIINGEQSTEEGHDSDITAQIFCDFSEENSFFYFKSNIKTANAFDPKIINTVITEDF